MDSEVGIVPIFELKEIDGFISTGLGLKEPLAPRIMRSLLQDLHSTDCGLFTALNSVLWTRGMLPQRKQYHKNRRITTGNLLPLAEMYARKTLTIEQLLARFLAHIAAIQAPLLLPEDALSIMGTLAATDIHHIRVGWIGFKSDTPTLVEWTGVMIKRCTKT
eukprot:TRINITY_DN38834_c0_g1_i2.p1 TRINITY_DN38834_c0_g1~~TRINITY_DN38834_c0_g1_i2.p1  ORF type:complete len:162 (+),score=9.55 TRINITY_DN38834_c0_g1_i2:172-657(+)